MVPNLFTAASYLAKVHGLHWHAIERQIGPKSNKLKYPEQILSEESGNKKETLMSRKISPEDESTDEKGQKVSQEVENKNCPYLLLYLNITEWLEK